MDKNDLPEMEAIVRDADEGYQLYSGANRYKVVQRYKINGEWRLACAKFVNETSDDLIRNSKGDLILYSLIKWEIL